ncbi:MAG: NfeD family protein [Lawsonibacter sp.]|nr:NfeD family protein [Oscillospiraceae bacterium]
MHPITWLIILVLFGIGEAVTVGLTSIWFALGALGALIVSQLGLGFWPQITTFIVLSALSMLLVRPFAKKFLRPGYSATNADRIIGATGLVTEEIDNLAGHGLVNIAGQVWSARSTEEGAVIPAGQEVRIVQIQGVKVLVEPVQAGGSQR